jgi:hypothetical protein
MHDVISAAAYVTDDVHSRSVNVSTTVKLANEKIYLSLRYRRAKHNAVRQRIMPKDCREIAGTMC